MHDNIPLSPGCYLFKDAEGRILYIGKSKCLRKRVASYYREQKDERIAQMMMFAISVDYLCTNTDIEAILLEYSLIKKYRPQYNVRMAKEREHWYIKVDTCQPIPDIFIVAENELKGRAKQEEQGIHYIGAFFRPEHAEEALETIGEYWHTPVCGFGKGKAKALVCGITLSNALPHV